MAEGQQTMAKIHMKIVTDEANQPVAVQIDYSDWLQIERALGAASEEPKVSDLAAFHGVLTLKEDPLEYQARLRNEWP